MGVLERLSTLIRANINDMLDQAEDPEIMLNQILRDMETEINRALDSADALAETARSLARELLSDAIFAERSDLKNVELRVELRAGGLLLAVHSGAPTWP